MTPKAPVAVSAKVLIADILGTQTVSLAGAGK
jgi:hypothetical protein